MGNGGGRSPKSLPAMGPGSLTSTLLRSPQPSLLFGLPSLSPTLFGSPACHWHSPQATSLLPFPALVCLVATGSIRLRNTCVQPPGSERERPSRPCSPSCPKGPAPGPALRRQSMALQWAPRDILLPKLGPDLCLEPGAPGAPPPARATPFTHQEKGTQQAIPTRSPAAQYNNSWGKWEGPGIQREEWSKEKQERV